MTTPNSIIIIGATSAIAEHCARLWLAQGATSLALVGRDAGRTERVAADLRVRSPGANVQTVVADFLDPKAISDTVAALLARGPADVVLIAHGMLPDAAACRADLALCREALEVNAISPVLYAEAFANGMAPAGYGTIAVIGSVAGDRGRKSNYVYGAAKGLVEVFVEGLQHRFAGTGLKCVLIKPGPTATPMTAHLQAQGAKLAPVEDVARDIVAAIARRQPTAYVPGKWRLIMLIIRNLPRFVFNKMDI
jgi:decaprenylphospho-beta-D-erythro-pentofuranosid-2-ulose 2-reductase